MNHSGHGQSSSTGTLQAGGEGAGPQESEPEEDHLLGPMKTGWDPQTHAYGDVFSRPAPKGLSSWHHALITVTLDTAGAVSKAPDCFYLLFSISAVLNLSCPTDLLLRIT